MKQLKINSDWFKNPKGTFRTLTILLFILFLFKGVPAGNSPAYAQMDVQIKDDVYTDEVRDLMNTKLVEEVERYMNIISPNSKLHPGYLVQMCQIYDMDVIFVLAQGILESHLGTKGKATKTNSVWNVGTYDDGQVLYTYDDPNHSLIPYLTLLNERYLLKSDSCDVNDKEILHLVQDKGYTNYNGYRFASARGYENGLRNLMIKIDMETSISMFQDISNLSNEQISTFFNPAFHVGDELAYIEGEN